MDEPWVDDFRKNHAHFSTIIIIIFKTMLLLLNDLHGIIIPLTVRKSQRNQHNCHVLKAA
jgi:hypothetical protein